MSNTALFVVGVFVMLLVGTSMSLLVWGAILDGRDEHERRVTERDASDRRRTDPIPTVVDAA